MDVFLKITVNSRQKPVKCAVFFLASMFLFLLLGINVLHAMPTYHTVLGTERFAGSVDITSIGHKVRFTDGQFREAMEAYQNDEYQLAIRLWRPLALDDHVKAKFFMGIAYDVGLGVERDPVQAVWWYKQAARGGNSFAQHNLGVAYAQGEGIETNMQKALNWWSRSAQQGNIDSQYNLGVAYALGNMGIEQDLHKASLWWHKAALNGDPLAQYNLGTLYANGTGVHKSLCEAIRWWERSAQNGLEKAQVAMYILKSRPDFLGC